MQWWNDFVSWFYSEQGQRVLYGAVVPFVAILTAGVLAAWISRSSVKRTLAKHDAELTRAAVGALINSARTAAHWHSLSGAEQAVADRAAGDADTQLRLLPVAGAPLAADWASQEIHAFKRASVNFARGVDGSLAQFRSRLTAWHDRPRRARKIFEAGLSGGGVENPPHQTRTASTAAAPAAPSPAASGVPAERVEKVPAPASAPAPLSQMEPPAPVPYLSHAAAVQRSAAGSTIPTGAAPAGYDVESTEREVEEPTEVNFAPPVSAVSAGRRTEGPGA